MNGTHIHLLVNHLPIVGSILAGIVLAHGLWSKTQQTIAAGYSLMIISSLGGLIAFFTGEAAEETAEAIEGVSRSVIHQHEESGEFAMICAVVLGLVAIVGLILMAKKPSTSLKVAWFALVVSLLCFASFAYTGYTGGQVRHTEVYAPTQQ
jgi:uncharacterized membrane protein